MQNQDNEIQRVQIHIDEARKIVAFGDTILRLINNKDYQEVIEAGYTGVEARRLTLLLGEESFNEKQKEAVVISLRAIGELHSYLRARLNDAEMMRNELGDAEEMLSDLESGKTNQLQVD